MPQLPQDVADDVANVESSFELLEEGPYVATLKDVTVSDSEGASGYHYWRWEFDLDDAPGRQWLNTSLSPKAYFKLQETFEAFDATPDTDTDELIGDKVRLIVSQTTAQGGKRKGELVNQVDSVLPLNGAGDVGGGDDIFDD